MHSDCCWCGHRFYMFSAAPVFHLQQDFSSLRRFIKSIMFLISVGMVAIMGQSDLGRASKMPINKLNLPCQYPLVLSLVLCFLSLHLLFSSSSFTPEKSPRSSSKPAVPESFALRPSFAFPAFLPPGKLVSFG